jgi:hypothetical protein
LALNNEQYKNLVCMEASLRTIYSIGWVGDSVTGFHSTTDGLWTEAGRRAIAKFLQEMLDVVWPFSMTTKEKNAAKNVGKLDNKQEKQSKGVTKRKPSNHQPIEKSPIRRASYQRDEHSRPPARYFQSNSTNSYRGDQRVRYQSQADRRPEERRDRQYSHSQHEEGQRTRRHRDTGSQARNASVGTRALFTAIPSQVVNESSTNATWKTPSSPRGESGGNGSSSIPEIYNENIDLDINLSDRSGESSDEDMDK